MSTLPPLAFPAEYELAPMLSVHVSLCIIVVCLCDRVSGCVPYQTEDVGVCYQLEVPGRHCCRNRSVGCVCFCARLAGIVAVSAAVSVVDAWVDRNAVRDIRVGLRC